MSKSAIDQPLALKPAHQQLLQNFDLLPDSADVPVQVVAARRAISVVTVWRWSKAGLLPAPKKTGGTTRWNVGALRAAA